MGRHCTQVHFVWIGRRFPYHARLAVESAATVMPTARVTLHTLPPHATGPDVDAVLELPNVRVRSRSLIELTEDSPDPEHHLALGRRLAGAAAVSNLARLLVLHREGGVYLDTDVLVVRPLDDPGDVGAYVGAEWVWEHNRRRVEHRMRWSDVATSIPWATARGLQTADLALTRGRLRVADRWRPGLRLQVNNAVVGAPPRSPFVRAALRSALVVDPNARFALGPSLLDDVSRARPELVHVLPSSRFYAVPPGQSRRWFDDATFRPPEDAQVIHYVASNHRTLLAELDEHDPRFESGQGAFWTAARRTRHAARTGVVAVGAR